MTRPAVSDAAERLYDRLRPYQQDDDAEDAGGWALLCMEEAAASTLTRVQEWLRHDDTGSGRRRVMDPWRTPEWVLPWLAQFTGTRIPIGATVDQARALIAENPYMWRGTIPYIRTAVAVQLDSADPFIYILENPGAVYGTLTLSTLTAETPNPDAAAAALRAAVPWWVVPTHHVIDGGSYEDLKDLHSDYADVLATFDDYVDVLSDPTQT